MNDRDKILLDYTWKWFEYHAGQRMKAFHFFLLFISAIGFISIGILNREDCEKYIWLLIGVIGLLMAVISSLFWILDVRNRELVKCGRKVLDELENKLRQPGNISFLVRYYDKERICLKDFKDIPEKFKDKDKTPIRHSFVFGVIFKSLFILGNILFLSGIVIHFLNFSNIGEGIILKIITLLTSYEEIFYFIIFLLILGVYLYCLFIFRKYIPKITMDE